jgi:hypothetical protein
VGNEIWQKTFHVHLIDTTCPIVAPHAAISLVQVFGGQDFFQQAIPFSVNVREVVFSYLISLLKIQPFP